MYSKSTSRHFLSTFLSLETETQTVITAVTHLRFFAAFHFVCLYNTTIGNNKVSVGTYLYSSQRRYLSSGIITIVIVIMKIFNKNNLVLAMACLLAIAAVASGAGCTTDADCMDDDKCVCNLPCRRLEENPQGLRKVNEQAAAAIERGLEAAAGSRRAKSGKGCSCGTCVPKSSKSSKSSSIILTS